MTVPTREQPGEGTGGTRPLRRDAQRNRGRIVEAAREVLADRGIALTLNDVAHHAGVGVGTVYRHFPDKAELVDAALAGQLEALAVIVEEGLAAETAWDGLVAVLTRGMAAHVANRGLRDVALAVGKGDHQAAAVGRVLPLMEALLARARAEGSLRPDVTLADITMIHFMVTELADHGASVAPEAYLRYLHLFVEALRARPDAEPLGPPMTEEEVRGTATRWIDAHRGRAR